MYAIVLIQVDIGGHLPIPLGTTPLFLSVSLIVAQFTIFSSSLGLELSELFLSPNRHFLGMNVVENMSSFRT